MCRGSVVNLKMLKAACAGKCDRGKVDLVTFPVTITYQQLLKGI
jgi:hypothetical protein